jgi:hypothetical protein
MSVPDVLRFVKTHIFATLTVAVGEYSAFSLTAAFTAKIEECLDEVPDALPFATSASTGDRDGTHPGPGPSRDAAASSVPPTAPPPLPSMFRKKQPSISGEAGRPLALVVLSDPLERSWVARTLLGEGLDVRSNETIHELLEILREPAVLRVAVVDLERADLEPVLRAIAELRPELPLIVCTAGDVTSASSRVRATGVRLLHVHAKTSPRRGLVECVLQHASDCLL